MRHIKHIASISAIAMGGLLTTGTARATDLEVAAGTTVPLSSNAAYESGLVQGALNVSGGAQIDVNALTLEGGVVSVSGANTRFGYYVSGAANKTICHIKDREGVYGRFAIKDTTVSKTYSVGIAQLYLDAPSGSLEGSDGYIDFASISNGALNVREAFNDSTLTGRVTVAGNALVYRGENMTTAAIFRRGAFRFDLEDADTTLLFDFNTQWGTFNDAGSVVEVVGKGTLKFSGTYQTSTPCWFKEGARFNHEGWVCFSPWKATDDCRFVFSHSDVIGPNVKGLRSLSGHNSGLIGKYEISSGVTLSLNGDVDFVQAGDQLTGGGIRIDSTGGTRSFKANILAGDTLVVEKIGEGEMVVSQTTNISHLVVSEGTVRVNSDCRIQSLSCKAGTRIIADGAVVTIDRSDRIVDAFLECVNGGSFASPSESPIYVYRPGGLSGLLHVSSGNLIFSGFGYDYKYWRWTFKKTTSPNANSPLILRGLWLFGDDGQMANYNLSYGGIAKGFEGYAPVAKGKARWFVRSTSTEVGCAAGQDAWLNESNLYKWFEFGSNGGHLPYLTTPLLNPDDSNSWLSVEMCLKDGARPVTGYTLLRGYWNAYRVTDWSVEASSDGTTWVAIEEKAIEEEAGARTGSSEYCTYDGKPYVKNMSPLPTASEYEYFKLSGRQGTLTPSADPLSVQVDESATLDLTSFSPAQKISAITLDMSKGGGTIKGGEYMANGTLTIVSPAERPAGTLPIALTNPSLAANLDSWAVVINGKVSNRRLQYNAATSTIEVIPPGLTLVIR